MKPLTIHPSPKPERLDDPVSITSADPLSVAVLMCAHNADKTLLTAVTSTFSGDMPVALYLVDDGSRISVRTHLMEAFASLKPAFQLGHQLHLVSLPTNIGLTNALNIGLRHIFTAGHPFIARMDADDINHASRFAKQLAFLQAHPTIAMVGTWATAVDEHTAAPLYPIRLPASPAEVLRHLPLDSCFVHPTVMFRASMLKAAGGYDNRRRSVEDYELFLRLARRHPLANIPEFLLDYRLSSGGISLTRVAAQRRGRLHVQLQHFQPQLWQSWAGVAKSLLRLIIPTRLVEFQKRLRGRP